MTVVKELSRLSMNGTESLFGLSDEKYVPTSIGKYIQIGTLPDPRNPDLNRDT